MSFALTTEQVRARTKTVTRRLGWEFLQPGDLVRAVRKAMGLRKGERVEPLATLRIVSVRRESLLMMIVKPAYGRREVEAEGFTGLTRQEFVTMFSATHRGCAPETKVTRIEFEYVA